MSSAMPNLLLAAVAADKAARLLYAFWALLLFWGVYRCWLVSRRPGVNAKAALSLGSFLGGWLLFAVGLLIGGPASGGVLVALFVVAGCGLVSGAFVLAVLGLLEIHEGAKRDQGAEGAKQNQSAGRASRGRRQAWASLALCVAMAGVVGLGVLYKIGSSLTETADPARRDATVIDASRFADELNFRYQPPMRWTAMEIENINEDAVVGYTRARPKVYFMIIAENAGDPELAVSTAGMVDLAVANLRSASSAYELISQQPSDLHGLPGVRLLSRARVGTYDIFYTHWIYSRNGFVYQLVAWANAGKVSAEKLSDHARQAFEGFQIVDQARVARSARELDDFTSERYGYSVELTGGGWRSWETLDAELEGAELGGLRGPGGAFAIIPVDLHGLDPPLDALATSLLDGLDVALDDPVISARRFEDDGLEVLVLDYWRHLDGAKWIYRLRVSKSRGFGYLVAAWRKEGGEPTAEALDDLLERVTVNPEHAAPVDRPERTAAELAFHSRIINDIGLFFSGDERHEESARYFQRAFEINPNDGVILSNAVDALTRAELHPEALALLAANEDRFASDLELLSYRPYLEMQLGEDETAAEGYAALFARGYRNVWDLSDYLDLLWRMDRQDDALAAIASFRQGQDSGQAARLEADLHQRRGDHDRAIAVLRQRRSADTEDHELARELVYAHIEAEQLQEARELAAKLVEDDPESSENHYVRGRSEYALGEFGKAKAAFESVLERRPGDRSAREYLDHVSALLGEGENSTIKKPIEAVEIPERLLLSLAEPESEADHGDLGAYYVDRVTAISFKRGEDYRRTEHRLLRVRERKALEVFSTFEYTFDPLSEEIYVNGVTVRDGAGEIAAVGDVSDYYLSDPPDDGMATQDRQVNIPVPGLEPGFSVELVVTRRYRSAPEEMPFLRFTPTTSYVVQNGVLLVRGDVEDLIHRTRNGPPVEITEEELVWRVRRPGPFRWEPFGADADSYLPYLWLGSKQDSWEDLGASYLEEIAERLEPHPLVSELGVQLERQIEGPEARIEALVRYVQGYSYQAIEFGRRARMPLPVEEVVARKYGDCKDHSLLLYHLLRANDVPAELVLVNNSTDVLAEVPSLDQFNHMIVHVPDDGVGRFLDGTAKDHRIAAMPPFGLGGRFGLLLSSERARLVKLPDFAAEQNRVVSERSVEMLAGGDARVRETLTLTGVSAANIRGALKNVDEPTRQNMIQRTMSEHGPQVTVRELTARHLDAADEPLVLEIDYLVKERLQPAGEELVGRIPASWEGWFLAAAPVEQRRTPFRVTYPLQLESKVTVRSAKGRRIVSGEIEPPHRDRFSSWSLREEASPQGPTFHWHLRLESGDHPAELYSGFEQSMSRAVRSIERKVRLLSVN